jgi:hypothetical protein
LFEEIPVKVVRGKKSKSIKTTKPSKKSNRAPRGSVGAAIIKFLQRKGSNGAHVREVAEAVGSKPANVTSFFYSIRKKKIVKHVGPGTFALVGKPE